MEGTVHIHVLRITVTVTVTRSFFNVQKTTIAKDTGRAVSWWTLPKCEKIEQNNNTNKKT